MKTLAPLNVFVKIFREREIIATIITRLRQVFQRLIVVPGPTTFGFSWSHGSTTKRDERIKSIDIYVLTPLDYQMMKFQIIMSCFQNLKYIQYTQYTYNHFYVFSTSNKVLFNMLRKSNVIHNEKITRRHKHEFPTQKIRLGSFSASPSAPWWTA